MEIEHQMNGSGSGEYEERQRVSLMDMVNNYLVNLNDAHVLLHTYIYDKNARSNLELDNVVFGFRVTFKQLFFFTAPLILTGENSKLREEIDEWFKKEIHIKNIRNFDTKEGKLVKNGLALCAAFQEKLRENNLMPIRPCIIKPPFDVDISEMFKEDKEDGEGDNK